MCELKASEPAAGVTDEESAPVAATTAASDGFTDMAPVTDSVTASVDTRPVISEITSDVTPTSSSTIHLPLQLDDRQAKLVGK